MLPADILVDKTENWVGISPDVNLCIQIRY